MWVKSAKGSEVLKCMACGTYSHRSCAFRSSYEDRGKNTTSDQVQPTEVQICTVNGPLVKQITERRILYQIGREVSQSQSNEKKIDIHQNDNRDGTVQSSHEDESIEGDELHEKDQSEMCEDKIIKSQQKSGNPSNCSYEARNKDIDEKLENETSDDFTKVFRDDKLEVEMPSSFQNKLNLVKDDTLCFEDKVPFIAQDGMICNHEKEQIENHSSTLSTSFVNIGDTKNVQNLSNDTDISQTFDNNVDSVVVSSDISSMEKSKDQTLKDFVEDEIVNTEKQSTFSILNGTMEESKLKIERSSDSSMNKLHFENVSILDDSFNKLSTETNLDTFYDTISCPNETSDSEEITIISPTASNLPPTDLFSKSLAQRSESIMSQGTSCTSASSPVDVEEELIEEKEALSDCWSCSGPPTHWAINDPSILKGLKNDSYHGSDLHSKEDDLIEEKLEQENNGNNKMITNKSNNPLQSFQKIGNALQSNFLAHLNRTRKWSLNKNDEENTSNEAIHDKHENKMFADPQEVLCQPEKEKEEKNKFEGNEITTSSTEIYNNTCCNANENSNCDTVIALNICSKASHDTNKMSDRKVISNQKSIIRNISNQMGLNSDHKDLSDLLTTCKRSCQDERGKMIDENFGNDELPKDGDNQNIPNLKEVEGKSLLETKEPRPPAPTRAQIAKTHVSNVLNAVQNTAKASKNLGIASVAGGIAGGVAGLVLAGPSGALVGARLGQVACAAVIVVEGSASVLPVVAGVAGTVAGAVTIANNRRKEDSTGRMLAIGEDGTGCKVVLVRPNIKVDPVWKQKTENARRTAPAKHDGISIGLALSGLIPGNNISHPVINKRRRKRTDADIATATECEIATEEKILLLVSSSLNDKTSLPGHVYRCLMKDYKSRAYNRVKSRIKQKQDVADVKESWHEGTRYEINANMSSTSQGHNTEEETECSFERGTRQDTHAVIKYITATFLEVKPGFCASPAITESTATAVEVLVFGEIYDYVYDEIVEETKQKDSNLYLKIEMFLKNKFSKHEAQKEDSSLFLDEESCEYKSYLECIEDNISNEALNTLRMLPEAHCIADKLMYCVDFLEHIAKRFHDSNDDDCNKKDDHKRSAVTICADSLLKMVCQHIVVAGVPNINAEISFLEEFARDEQLLRGIKGYALITIQASLHFMNASSNFDLDIFYDET